MLAGCMVVAQSDSATIQAGSVTFSGSIRERYEAWRWFEPAIPGAENVYGFSGTIFRFGISQKRDKYDWNIEFAVPVLLGLPSKAVLPAPQGQLGLGASYYAANDNQEHAASIFPKQAFLRIGGAESQLRLGRFEFSDGAEVKPKDETLATLKNDRIKERLIGPFGFSDVMRSFDGIHYAYSREPWNFTAMSTIPTRGVFQVDGWAWVKTPVTYVALTRESSRGHTQSEWRIFGIYYNDSRGVEKVDNRPAALRAADSSAINIGTYGGHIILAAPTGIGTFDLLGWGALQSGSWGSQSQRAAAGVFEGGWQPHFAEVVRPWFRGGIFYSTGDSDPSDGVHGTFFSILPTPRIYARFPFFNEMNNKDVFGEVELRPNAKLTLRSDVHGLWLANRNDLWYIGGGAYQPETFGYQGRPSNGQAGLATFYDISSDYKWKYGISVGLYFGYAVGGPVVEAIYPTNPNGALGYVEFNYHF